MMNRFPVSHAQMGLARGLGQLSKDDLTSTATETLVTTLQPQTTQVLTNSLDKFIRETEGGKQLLNQVKLYAMIPYALAGFALGYVIGRR